MTKSIENLTEHNNLFFLIFPVVTAEAILPPLFLFSVATVDMIVLFVKCLRKILREAVLKLHLICGPGVRSQRILSISEQKRIQHLGH